MALVITVREMTSDLQTVLRLLQVTCWYCPYSVPQGLYNGTMSVRPSVPAWDYNNKPLLQGCRFAAVGPVGRTYVLIVLEVLVAVAQSI